MNNTSKEANRGFRLWALKANLQSIAYKEQLAKTPELRKYALSQQEYYAHIAVTRLYLAMRENYSQELAERIYEFSVIELLGIEQNMRINANMIYPPKPLYYKHIATEFIYRLLMEKSLQLTRYSNPSLALFRYGCGLSYRYRIFGHEIPVQTIMKYTGFSLLSREMDPASHPLRKKLLAEMSGHAITNDPYYEAYRDLLLYVSPAERRYLYLSDPDSVRILATVDHNSLGQYLRKFMRRYPFGLPSPMHTQMYVNNFSSLTTKITPQKYILTISKENPGADFMAVHAFGASCRELKRWLGADDTALNELCGMASTQLDPKECSYRHEYRIIRSMTKQIYKRFILQLWTKPDARNALFECIRRVAISGTLDKYMESVGRLVSSPNEITQDMIYVHYRDFTLPNCSNKLANIFGYEKHDAIFTLTRDLWVNEAITDILGEQSSSPKISKQLRENAQRIIQLFDKYMLSREVKQFYAKQGAAVALYCSNICQGLSISETAAKLIELKNTHGDALIDYVMRQIMKVKQE